ncbi:MAG: DNA cytosine methyltransferase [Gemmatimonadales bacterium]|nr:DNA cytosine methyltransferase [Gemmatimonadales bacterium]
MALVGIDLFAGAGGMSLGARLAGVSVTFATELDSRAAATYHKNNPASRVILDDIRNIGAVALRGHQKPSAPVVVFGGPPCQGFSTSNQRTRSKENPNNWLLREFLRVIREVRPHWVVFENVKGFVETEGGLFLRMLLQELHDLRFATAHKILNADAFGVPQRRGRFFLVANRCGVDFRFPEGRTTEPVTVRDAIADLPHLCNGATENWRAYREEATSPYARSMRGKRKKSPNHLVSRNADWIVARYPFIPPGGNWESIPERLMRNYANRARCHTGIYHRLSLGRPAVVLGNFRKNMLIHPTQHRGLSVREAARLQSFPDNYEFVGSIGFQQQQVGNAVPPLLAKAVFKEIVGLCGA